MESVPTKVLGRVTLRIIHADVHFEFFHMAHANCSLFYTSR